MTDSGINDQNGQNPQHSFMDKMRFELISYFVLCSFQRKIFNTTKLLRQTALSVKLIIKSEQSDTDSHHVMYQFGASSFYTLVH